ncbi:MAG TPA: hypothetical protein VE954_22780 [Oligoflexus sp.]|uniref:hypothetical protein n=1 Tax=Oligoflexus sp. TaxID=1971216 RepID=UPI002D4F5826|nr:hypothetical protein [Oligoflexus sp.]HYX35936.1 hypothetical protein [Oligoflexus sp.]
MFPNTQALLMVLVIITSGCQKSKSLTGGSEAAKIEQSLPLTASPKAQVKRMRADLLRNNLAKILVLDPQGMCLELGRLPCADLVHKVSLGSMNAYGNAQYRHPEQVSATSAMSLDRLVLSACMQRAQLDLVNPGRAVIFKDVELSTDGRLVKSEAVVTAIHTLYQRAFLRDASATELENLLQFYEAIYAQQSIGAARNWMTLSCYAVLTSVEATFY